MNIDQFDDNTDLLMDKISLIGETCGLKHSKEDPSEDHPAVEYLCQHLGNPGTGEAQEQLRIPVCKDCLEALYDPNWILMYCVYCHRSQWLYRPYAKLNYPDGNVIYWMDVCPFCTEVNDTYGKNC